MKLLCHRGAWKTGPEKNTLQALMLAIRNGWGVETDIRDLDGELVISHDPPRAGCLSLDAFLRQYALSGQSPLLALNIKADGLQEPLQAALKTHGIENYFVFDMSVPDALGYHRRRMPVGARISEYEQEIQLDPAAQYIWLDAFHDEWYGNDEVRSWLEAGRSVCIVSPELHRRPHETLWKRLSELPDNLMTNLWLCTDLFSEAAETFHVEKN